MLEATFDRNYAKDILSERLQNYMKEFAADVTLNETNIHDKTLQRSALAAKWCRYEYEEKRYKDKISESLDDLRTKIQQKLFEQKNAAVTNQTANETMIKVKTEQILKTAPQYLKIKDELESQDEIIRFIGEAKQIISQFGFDIKNSIDILKLEQI